MILEKGTMQVLTKVRTNLSNFIGNTNRSVWLKTEHCSYHFPGLSSSLAMFSVPSARKVRIRKPWQGEGGGGWEHVNNFNVLSIPPPPRIRIFHDFGKGFWGAFFGFIYLFIFCYMYVPGFDLHKRKNIIYILLYPILHWTRDFWKGIRISCIFIDIIRESVK